MLADAPAPAPAPPRPRVGRRGGAVGPAQVGRAALVVYASVAVLIPLAALVGRAGALGPARFVDAVTTLQARDALLLTVGTSALATLVNTVAGLGVAWVLARDRFWGQGVLNAVVDLPFALPTVVAGVTLYTLYGPESPLHLNATGSWTGITLAVTFVTLPLTVRGVQPLLEGRAFTAERAAETLGASPARIFATITLRELAPAILTGAGLAFARALGEYGSVVFISNNLPYRTEVASSYIYSLTDAGDTGAAAAVSVTLLLGALAVMAVVHRVAGRSQRWYA